jgi:hypothetical protein
LRTEDRRLKFALLLVVVLAVWTVITLFIFVNSPQTMTWGYGAATLLPLLVLWFGIYLINRRTVSRA